MLDGDAIERIINDAVATVSGTSPELAALPSAIEEACLSRDALARIVKAR